MCAERRKKGKLYILRVVVGLEGWFCKDNLKIWRCADLEIKDSFLY